MHDNIVDGNQLFGIVLFNASGEQIYDNRVYGNHSSGVRAEAGSTGNVFKDNIAEGNTGYDLEDDNSGCETNTWHDNTFFFSNESCIK